MFVVCVCVFLFLVVFCFVCVCVFCFGVFGVFGCFCCVGCFCGFGVFVMFSSPPLSARLGLLRRFFGLESLGLEACMDESLGHRYLSLAGSHGFVPWQTDEIKANVWAIAIVSHKNQPASERQHSWPWQ